MSTTSSGLFSDAKRRSGAENFSHSPAVRSLADDLPSLLWIAGLILFLIYRWID